MELVALHQPLLHQVLNVLHQDAAALLLLNAVDDGVYILPGQPVLLGYLGVGLFNGNDNFAAVVIYTGTVPFNNLHGCSPLIGKRR